MNLGCLTPEDWQEFAVKHRTAYMFLLERALVGELFSLRRLGKTLNGWETKRLAEPEDWYKRLACKTNGTVGTHVDLQ